jgi:hypothetical protein
MGSAECKLAALRKQQGEYGTSRATQAAITVGTRLVHAMGPANGKTWMEILWLRLFAQSLVTASLC